jgi:hypothetical protein
MDLIATPVDDKSWELTNLLWARTVAVIDEASPDGFVILPVGPTLKMTTR